VLVVSHPERSSSSTDVHPSLKRLYHKKSFPLAHGIISEGFLDHSVGFCSNFLKIETEFDADSLLLKIGRISCKKVHRITKT
jgi:hypothetical protein